MSGYVIDQQNTGDQIETEADVKDQNDFLRCIS